MTVGERIKKIRQEKGLSQKQLGEKLGVSQQMIGQYENPNSNLKTDTISKIAYALDVSFVDIIGTPDQIMADYYRSIGKNNEKIPDEPAPESIELANYTHELGEFLYYNPKHKPLFDSAMEVKANDIDFAKQMLDRINGKTPDEPS